MILLSASVFAVSVMAGLGAVIQRPSQNQDDRLLQQVEMVLIAASPLDCRTLLTNLTSKPSGISYHYVVCQNGTVYQLVSETKRAWFAPSSAFWHGRNRINDWSIGIISVGSGSNATIATAKLVADIRTRHEIPSVNVIGEFDVNVYHAPTAYPNWESLAKLGVGLFPNITPRLNPGSDSFDYPTMLNDSYLLLKAIGYSMSPQGSTKQSAKYNMSLAAFQRRFLEQSGPLSLVLTPSIYQRIKAVHSVYMEEYGSQWTCRSRPNPLSKPPPNISYNTSFTSKNQDQRLYGPPIMIVIHNTEQDLALSLKTLVGNTSREVSAHYLVSKSGVIYRLVSETRRAYQAGVSDWAGYHNINGLSIGIEIVNEDSAKLNYTSDQITSVILLIQDIRTRYNIPDEFIVSHEDIAPTRRSDPGRFFPWVQLAESGIGLWYKSASQSTKFVPWPDSDPVITAQRSRTALARIGYKVDNTTTEKDVRLVVQRFQWRFMPSIQSQAKGDLDAKTIKRISLMEYEYVQAYRRRHAFRSLCWVPVPSGASSPTGFILPIILKFLRLLRLLH